MMLLLLSFLFEKGIMMSSTFLFFFLTGICYDDTCHLKKYEANQ